MSHFRLQLATRHLRQERLHVHRDFVATAVFYPPAALLLLLFVAAAIAAVVSSAAAVFALVIALGKTSLLI